MSETKLSLSGSALKIIAIIAMTADHIGYLLFPNLIILRIIGRLTFPIMAFLVCEGYTYTHDVKKYILRLFIFGIITFIPYYMAFGTGMNVMFTLCAGVFGLYIYDNFKGSAFKQGILLVLLWLATLFCDWGACGVWVILILYRSKGRFSGLLLAIFLMMTMSSCTDYVLDTFYYHTNFTITYRTILIKLSLLIAIIPIMLYNHKRGLKIKYFFYIYYPLHIFVLALIAHPKYIHYISFWFEKLIHIFN